MCVHTYIYTSINPYIHVYIHLVDYSIPAAGRGLEIPHTGHRFAPLPDRDRAPPLSTLEALFLTPPPVPVLWRLGYICVRACVCVCVCVCVSGGLNIYIYIYIGWSHKYCKLQDRCVCVCVCTYIHM